MACSDYDQLVEALQAFQFHDAVACTYTEPAGTIVTGLFTFGFISVALYFRSGGITMPVVMTLLVGSILLPFLPGAATQMAGLILLVAIGVGPVLLLRRMGV